MQVEHPYTTFEWDLTREITAVLMTVSKNLNFDMLSDIYEPIHSYRSVRRKKYLCQLSFKIFSWLGWNVVYCWDLLVWCIKLKFNGENYTSVISLKRIVMLACLWISMDQFCFKLSIIIETTKLYTLIPVWMTMMFIQGYSCMRNQKLLCSFSH